MKIPWALALCVSFVADSVAQAQCDTDMQSCGAPVVLTPPELPGVAPGGSGSGGGPYKNPRQPPPANPHVVNYSSAALQKSSAASVTNTISRLLPKNTAFDLDANSNPILMWPAGLLPVGQASAQPEPSVMNLAHTEPVTGSGEFLLTETDFVLPGYGIDFVFHRYYRSGVSTGTALGRGWSHSYRQMVLPSDGVADAPFTTSPCAKPTEVDRFLVTEKLERQRFAHRPSLSTASRQVFVDPQDPSVELDRDDSNPAMPWSLHRKGDQVTSFFDGNGNLVRTSDRLGHALTIAMQSGVVSKVVDTTGRAIYFVTDTNGGLACLSPTNDCNAPYVRFSYLNNGVTYLDEQDQKMRYLVAVTDAENRTYRTYGYWHQNDDPAATKALTHQQFSAIAADACRHECGTHAADCRNEDLCEEVALAEQKQICTIVCDPNSVGLPGSASCGRIDPGCLNQWQIQRVYKLNPTCWNDCSAKCLKQLAPPIKWFGQPGDLVGNLVEVRDGTKNIIVKNGYGEDIGKMDYDRVILHQQNLPGMLTMVVPGQAKPVVRRPRPDTFNASDFSQAFVYHDLTAEAAAGITSPNVISDANWTSLNLCPCDGAQCAVPVAGPRQVQDRRYAVEIRDLNGVSRTQYFDAFWRLLRTVNTTTKEQEDYNYVNGRPTAERNTLGQRVCRAYDNNGLLTRVTSLASAGRSGDSTPQVTTYGYDANFDLIAAIEGGTNPSGTTLLRDDLGRVVAVGSLVDAAHTIWSCAEYTDDLPRIGGKASEPGRGRPPNAAPTVAGSDPQAPFIKSGCATTVRRTSTPGKRFRAVTPSKLTSFSGTVTLQQQIGVGGPQSIVTDATGPDPIYSYVTYDADGRPTETGQNAQGHYVVGSKKKTTYDHAGLTISVETDDVDGTAHKTARTYDAARYVATISDERSTATLRHDGFGQLLQIKRDAPGTASQVTCMQYDALGRLVRRIRPEGELETRAYDASDRLQTIQNGWPAATPDIWAAGCTINVVKNGMEELAGFTYDASGFPTAQRRHGIATQTVADGFGRTIDEIHPRIAGTAGTELGAGKAAAVATHVVSGYDAHNRLVWTATYDRAPPSYNQPQPRATIPGLVSLTSFEYDGVGRPTKQTRWQLSGTPTVVGTLSIASVTTANYDDTNNSVMLTDEDGIATAVTQDGIGRTTKTIAAAGRPEQQTTTVIYSGGGTQRTTTISPAPTSTGSLTTKATLSPRGELLTETDTSGTAISQTFHNGLVTERQLRQQGHFELTYDAFWRLQQVQNEDLKTVIGYDRDDRTIALQTANAKYTTTYDPFDRVALSTAPIGQTSLFYPRNQSAVAKITDPSRITHLYTYDLSGRTTSVTTTRLNEPPVLQSFGYTALDQLATAERTVNGVKVANAWSYDGRGRVVQETSSVGQVTNVYRPLQRTTTLTASGESTTIEHNEDGLGRPTLLKTDGALFAALQAKTGALDRIHFANEMEQTLAYNDRAQPTTLTLTQSKRGTTPATAMFQFEQSYDKRDIPNQRKIQIGTAAPRYDLFESDKRGRVAAEILDATSNTWNTTNERRYILDELSNWKERKGKDAAQAVVNVASQLLSWGPQTFAYDKAGNVTSNATTATKQTLTWTPLGELESATDGASTVKYTYDALGRPITTESQNRHESTIWSGTERAAQVDAEGLRAFVAASPSLILGDTRPKTKHRTYLYPGFDGSTLSASINNAPLSEINRYSAYGENSPRTPTDSRLTTSATGASFRFQGQYQDPRTGYYALGARHYAPTIGRFLASDPIGIAGGYNPYVYVDGMPLSRSDPSGLSPTLQKNDPMQDQDTDSMDQQLFPYPMGLAAVEGLSDRVPPKFKPGEAVSGLGGMSVGMSQGALYGMTPSWLLRLGGLVMIATARNDQDPSLLKGALLYLLSGGTPGGPSTKSLANRVEEIAGARGSGKNAPFNQTGSTKNCVNCAVAFLNSVKEGELITATGHVAENLGSIAKANEQIMAQTGGEIGRMQYNELATTNSRQFFIVYPGTSTTTAERVLIGINNGGKTMFYDPQIGARMPAAGNFISFPVRLPLK